MTILAQRPTKVEPELTDRQKLALAIGAEAAAAGVPCDQRQAEAVIDFLQRAASKGGVNHLTQQELDTFHEVLDVVMPDDTAAVPESAHAMAERLCLEPGERFIHTKTEPRLGAIDCNVTIGVLSGKA